MYKPVGKYVLEKNVSKRYKFLFTLKQLYEGTYRDKGDSLWQVIKTSKGLCNICRVLRNNRAKFEEMKYIDLTRI